MPAALETEHVFRVIVVGAGVAGLVASHCLQKAGINHVVLEKGSSPAPAEGASIAIYPHGARILDQIGCLKAAKAACTPMRRFYNRDPNGAALVDSGFFDYVRENFGEDILLLERREYLQILYDNLPDKSVVRFNQKISDIIDDYEGVTVCLQDDKEERGDMVLGCDGVHSLVREIMWRNANTSIPGAISVREKTSMSTSWSCLFGVGPANSGVGERDMTCVHNDGFSFLVLSQPTKVFFFVFFRLNKKTTWPHRERFTKEDADRAAASVSGYPVSPSTVFGELWRTRFRGSMASLEEGILEHWYSDRLVLAGDAAHKITPNIALGGNSSMESVVTLVNGLHKLAREHAGAKPSRAALRRVFAHYQKQRLTRMHKIMEYSSLLTKLQAWDNPLLRFAATWVIPYVPDRLVADDLSKRFISTAPKLNFVKVDSEFGKHALMRFSDNAVLVNGSAKSSHKSTGMQGQAASLGLQLPRSVLIKQHLGEGDMVKLIGAILALLSILYWMSNVS